MIGETRVRGLELANVSLKKLLEYRVNSHWFMEHAGTRDYSRLRCFDGKSAAPAVVRPVHFFLGARLDQYREKVQSLQANSCLYAVRS
jgi:hypothetical protein